MTEQSHVLAQSIHDLGAAVWFGGSVMGAAGVNKSGADLHGIDRVRVASSAWKRFAPVQWAGVAGVVLGGLRLAGQDAPRLATQDGWARAGGTKVGVVVAGIAATAYAAYSGQQVGRLAEQAGDPEVADANTPTAQTPPELASWQKKQRAAQYLVPLLSGANIVLGSYHAQTRKPVSTARGLLGSVLPG